MRNNYCHSLNLSINLNQPKPCYMKYIAGQTVIVLDTEYKPAGKAIICNYLDSVHKYEVNFVYPDSEKPDLITVPEERLRHFSEMVA